ncbi:hypothetical protein [Gemmobacter denitrificans]|uniref:Uncharacterized protein n=1 Tax=Gemmobacter denitrificans TaxID=3123040 RepID=A0ABU8BUQ3_9RHOB
MKAARLTFLLACTLSAPAGAAPDVSKTYSYSDPVFAAQDEACIAAALRELAQAFDGLQHISLVRNDVFDIRNGFLAVYPGVKFRGKHGKAEGTMTCVFGRNGRSVTDVTFTFEGRGLAGFLSATERMEKNPRRITVTSYGSSVIDN